MTCYTCHSATLRFHSLSKQDAFQPISFRHQSHARVCQIRLISSALYADGVTSHVLLALVTWSIFIGFNTIIFIFMRSTKVNWSAVSERPEQSTILLSHITWASMELLQQKCTGILLLFLIRWECVRNKSQHKQSTASSAARQALGSMLVRRLIEKLDTDLLAHGT